MPRSDAHRASETNPAVIQRTSDIGDLTHLAPERRHLVERLAARVHFLRNEEICAQAALVEAQSELERLSVGSRLVGNDEGERDVESLRDCDRVRSEVERLERELVFVRGAINGHLEDLDEMLVARARA